MKVIIRGNLTQEPSEQHIHMNFLLISTIINLYGNLLNLVFVPIKTKQVFVISCITTTICYSFSLGVFWNVKPSDAPKD